MTSAPELLVVGHVTRDEFPGGIRWGGAATYAALSAARLGVSTALVTAAPPRAEWLDELHAAENLAVHVVPSETFTTFALDYNGPVRLLSMSARARSIAWEDVPPAFLEARVAYVGPVAAECDATFVQALAARSESFVGVGLQGWLRCTDERGLVLPAVDETIFAVAGLGAVVFSEHDHPDAERFARRFAEKGTSTALTRGSQGVTIFHPGAALSPTEVPAAGAHEVEPTGAGDVFGVIFTWELACGAEPVAAAIRAASVAARVVEGPGLGSLSRGAVSLSSLPSSRTRSEA